MGKWLKQLTEGLDAATKLLIALAGVIGAVILVVTLLKPFASSHPSKAPTNLVSPAISGRPAVGETLTCSQGSWSGSPVSFDYGWDRDGAPMGDSASVYTVAGGDVGQSLACTVTAANAKRQSASATSAAVKIPPPPSGTSSTPSGATLVWQHAISVPYNTPFSLNTTNVPKTSVNVDTGFTIVTEPGTSANLETYGSNQQQEQVAAWKGGKPTLSDCTNAFGSSSGTGVPLDKTPTGTWICAQTDRGLIARLRYQGGGVGSTGGSFSFYATVWQPPQ